MWTVERVQKQTRVLERLLEVPQEKEFGQGERGVDGRVMMKW